MQIITLLIMIFAIILKAEEIALKKFAVLPQKALYLTQPPDEKDRIFVLNQRGLIYIIKNGNSLENPFLDITDRVHGSLAPDSKEGLLGLAFHPKYKNNGFFFVHYVNKQDIAIVSRFTTTKDIEVADKNSEKIILELSQPTGNNIGGHLAFGPRDGMLYISFGDGGVWPDSENNPQNLANLYGSILRINIDDGDPYSIPSDNPFFGQYYKRSEIFCYGLQNPFRFSFDRLNNNLIIGDVSQESWEEVNWNSWQDTKGANFGWDIMEGKHCYDSESFCDTTGLILPVYEYPNNVSYMKKFVI